jgi:ribosome-binding ATPase YchF (GTP1/OBG family)
MLADLESIERRLQNLSRKVRGGDKEAVTQQALLERAKAALEEGRPARTVEIAEDETKAWRMLQLLTAKPVLYVCNVEEENAGDGNAQSARVAEMAAAEGAASVVISAKIEEELAQLDDEERAAFPRRSGVGGAGARPADPRRLRPARPADLLHRRPQGGPRLDRGAGAKAPQAAGVIHGDFERGFIRAETIAYEDFVALGGEQPAKEAGKMRAEGKGYVVADGDVLHFLHSG